MEGLLRSAWSVGMSVGIVLLMDSEGPSYHFTSGGPGCARKLAKHGPVSKTEQCSFMVAMSKFMLELLTFPQSWTWKFKPSKPFLPLSSVLVGVFYHSNRKDARIPPNLYFKVGSLLEELQSHVSNRVTFIPCSLPVNFLPAAQASYGFFSLFSRHPLLFFLT